VEEITLYKESVFLTEFKGDLNIIDKHIEHILLFNKGRSKTNVGGYQSNNITFGFEELCNFMTENANKLSSKKLILENFWLNINKKGEYNKSHVHGMFGFSAVYYHKVCCENAAIQFRHLIPTIRSEKYLINPMNQSCLFFSSMLPHSVKPCSEDNHVRVSIAFNFGS
jgi:hypothetical protein